MDNDEKRGDRNMKEATETHDTAVETDGRASCTCGWRSPPVFFDAVEIATWHRLSIDATIDNPLLDAFLAPVTAVEIDAVGSEYTAHRVRRDQLCAEYAWAIPTEPVIYSLAELSPICDLGCGTGYWARLLQKAGAEVLAVDVRPPLGGKNHYHSSKAGISRIPATIRHFVDVVRGDAADFVVPTSHALMLCWPPYNQPMAATALARYRGDRVIYVGENGDGCTADDAFHAALKAQWSEIAYYAIPQWPGIHDAVYVYERRKRQP